MDKRIIDVPTGRRSDDAILQLQQFTADMVSLTTTRMSGRVPTLLLTKAQAVALREALDELIPNLTDGTSTAEETRTDGLERRRSAA